MLMEKRICRRCTLETDFIPNNPNSDYLRTKCICASCHKKIQRAWKLKNRDKINALRRARYKLTNSYKLSSYRWRINNEDKYKKSAKETRKRCKNRINFNNMLRYTKKLNATPKWANLQKIKEIYLNRPDGYHVDHIIPLRGNTVSGLHVEYNLQYLTAKENQFKNNKLIDVRAVANYSENKNANNG